MIKKCMLCLQEVHLKEVLLKRLTTLSCGHVFHKDCVAPQLLCPQCHEPITSKDITIHDWEREFMKGIETDNKSLINLTISKIDKRRVLTKCIQDHNIVGVQTLLETGKLNFFKTQNGKTIIEDAHEHGNNTIINMISGYCDIDYEPPPPPPRPPPPSLPPKPLIPTAPPSTFLEPPPPPFNPEYKNIYPSLVI